MSCLTLVVAWIVLGSLRAYPHVLSTVYDNLSSSPTRFFIVTNYQNVSNEYHPRQGFVFQYIINALSQGGNVGSYINVAYARVRVKMRSENQSETTGFVRLMNVLTETIRCQFPHRQIDIISILP